MAAEFGKDHADLDSMLSSIEAILNLPRLRAEAAELEARSANVLNCLPKSAQPGATAALAEIWNAEDREHAEQAVKAFAADYGVKWPKAAAKITDDVDVLRPSTTTPPSTGSTCGPPTRSSRPLPPSGSANA